MNNIFFWRHFLLLMLYFLYFVFLDRGTIGRMCLTERIDISGTRI